MLFSSAVKNPHHGLFVLCTQQHWHQHVHSNWSGVFNLLKFDYTLKKKYVPCLVLWHPTTLTHQSGVEFPNPGSFCKPGFSGLGNVKPGFGFGFGFGSHVFAFTANWRGGGRAVAVDGWIGWANVFGSLSIISCCKIVGLIL